MNIGISNGYEKDIKLNEENLFPALIDTGATHTCISEEIVTKLNLVPSGQSEISSASQESVRVNNYRINLYIPIIKKTINNKTNINLFVRNTSVSALPSQHSHKHKILLGMDILAQCNFFMAHGEFIFSY